MPTRMPAIRSLNEFRITDSSNKVHSRFVLPTGELLAPDSTSKAGLSLGKYLTALGTTAMSNTP